MVQQLAGAGDPGETESPKAGRGVRYLRDEPAPSAQRMVLGHALRKRRKSLNLKQGQVARFIGGSASKVSRIENGRHQFKERDLQALFQLYGIDDPTEQELLLGLAAGANEAAWWQPWSWATSKHLQAVVSFEEMAQRIRSYEPLHIHGLLQTPAYSQAVINRGPGTFQELEARAQLRRERKARFADAPADKTGMFIIDEVTLRRPVGSMEVMCGQLEHLLELSADPRYQFRLAELGRCDLPVDLGATTIFDFAGMLPTLVYAEGFDGGLIIEDDEAVDLRVKAFDALLFASLAPRQTRRRISDLLRHYRR
ncbi:helix-turn-helix domain-containing protein [Streptomyces caeruleatus]|uniref:XRE family transcriptional regulator n=1 Tax=Streptomyces caeruleatus TaxID=661399 RepID=A0A101U634_9ACTN|nr:helix-turn-helix transcriptional regulator [Streptomyces caeruleatus]KUO04636.1 XRE family transcriptional regulator [Streptomyces caeruleatus]